jgi:hypothetical protein
MTCVVDWNNKLKKSKKFFYISDNSKVIELPIKHPEIFEALGIA